MKSIGLAALTVALISGSAYAADLGGSYKDGPSNISENPTAGSWAGPYIGIFGGYAFGGVGQRETNGGVDHKASYDAEGVFGGVTAGYNLQFRNIVIGLEVEGGYMDGTGNGRMDSSNPAKHQNLETEGGAYGVVAGRLGVALDRTLVYGKGGFAYFDGSSSQETTNELTPDGFSTQGTDAFSGFVYGGGVEHKLGGGLSVKIEYLHFDFDSEGGSQTRKSDGFVFTNESDLDMDTIKAGLNYRF